MADGLDTDVGLYYTETAHGRVYTTHPDAVPTDIVARLNQDEDAKDVIVDENRSERPELDEGVPSDSQDALAGESEDGPSPSVLEPDTAQAPEQPTTTDPDLSTEAKEPSADLTPFPDPDLSLQAKGPVVDINAYPPEPDPNAPDTAQESDTTDETPKTGALAEGWQEDSADTGDEGGKTSGKKK